MFARDGGLDVLEGCLIEYLTEMLENSLTGILGSMSVRGAG